MLPKIIVWDGNERNNLLNILDVKEEEIIGFESKGAAVDDFRHWINSTIGILSSRPNLKLIVWEAHELSWECQAVLLKPLEEMTDTLSIYLVVNNENSMALTIISRCTVLDHKEKNNSDDNWLKLMDCWKSGPAACIQMADGIDLDKARETINEAVYKLNANLVTGVSEKRLAILNEVLVCAEDLKQKNINFKLAFGDFLLRSWQLIKT